MESCLTYLEGSRTHARYDADSVHTTDPVDGAPLLARYDLERVARTMTPRSLVERHGPGMWRWSELLPVRDRSHVVHLGEGSTPLLPARRLGAALGIDNLLVKAEGLNPTGSFKARGMAAAVSRARELGARSLIVPSAGNAGGALAAYGAAAGLPVTVVVPVDTPPANIAEAQMMGADVVLVEGVISDCGAVARAIAAQTGAFDVSTLKEPYRVEGKKTMGLELVEQLAWAVPDVIVYPTGGGTGLVGMWKAFDELEALGLIGSGRPRMVAAQAEGCAPIVRAFRSGAETAIPWTNPHTRASGLRVPSAIGDRLILTALRESAGTAVAVPEDSIDRIQRLAGKRGAGYVSPESAAAFAAVAILADEGWVSANERVVVFDCGVGHKYPPPALERPPVVAPDVAGDLEAIGRLIQALRGEGGTVAAAVGGLPSGGAIPVAEAEEPTPPSSPVMGEEPEPGAAVPAPRPVVQTSTTTSVSALATLMARRRAERRQAEARTAAEPPAVLPPEPVAAPEPPVAALMPEPEPVAEPEPASLPAPDPDEGVRLSAVLGSGPVVPGEAPAMPRRIPPTPTVPGSAPPTPTVPGSAPAPAPPATGPAPSAPAASPPPEPPVLTAEGLPTRRRRPNGNPDGNGSEATTPHTPPPGARLPVPVGTAPPRAAATARSGRAVVGPLPAPPFREIVVKPLPEPPGRA